ncbi:hypothetical protein MMC09_005416 [Bachmanniomyces sp. S44760]|nr:hypothetical protein [Bachmanniomyces sp. S44760]
MATGLAVWLGSAHALYGDVTVSTTGEILPCVYGTVASAFSPLPYTLIISLIKPQNFDWDDFRKEKLAFDSDDVDDNDIEAVTQPQPQPHSIPTDSELQTVIPPTAQQQTHLKRWARIAAYWSTATFLGHWVLWPLPMYASKYQFSKTFFTAWLVVAIIWIWVTLLIVGFFPLVDGRGQFGAVWVALRRGGGGGGEGEEDEERRKKGSGAGAGAGVDGLDTSTGTSTSTGKGSTDGTETAVVNVEIKE